MTLDDVRWLTRRACQRRALNVYSWQKRWFRPNVQLGVQGSQPKPPRGFLDLREAGETCSKHRVARLRREANLRALHGYRTRRWAVGKPSVLIANLFKRQFTATRPNTSWVAGTYIRTRHGWLYLAVMDLVSRMIVGWATGPTIHREHSRRGRVHRSLLQSNAPPQPSRRA